MAFYFYSSNYLILVPVSHMSPTPFIIHSQPLVHLNYLNIIFYRQLWQSAPVICKNHIVVTPVTVLVAYESGWRVGRMTLTGQKPNIQRKTFSTATLSTKNFTVQPSDWTQVSTVTDQELTAWAMPFTCISDIQYALLLYQNWLYLILHTGHCRSQNGKHNL